MPRKSPPVLTKEEVVAEQSVPADRKGQEAPQNGG